MRAAFRNDGVGAAFRNDGMGTDLRGRGSVKRQGKEGGVG